MVPGQGKLQDAAENTFVVGTLVSLEAHYSLISFMLFYHIHSKQPWWPGWTSQEKWGAEEIRT